MKTLPLQLLLLLTLLSGLFVKAQSPSPLQGFSQQQRVSSQPWFRVQNPDRKLSPKTGMTRRHWKEAGLYLLRGAFSYIHSLDDPMQFPKEEGKSYPRNQGQVPTEKLEGLCRTLFIAAPLLKEDPLLQLNNIPVAAYYRHHMIKLLDSSSASFIKHRAKNGGPNQNLVEFGALAISLFTIPEIIWDPLTQSQKDALAATMLSYGDGPTVASNWKFFNIFVLSFFKSRGYAVNEKLLVEYLEKSLDHYRGDGWYNDAPAYDYYSMWAYQMYGPLWGHFFGNQYYPQYARRFMDNFSPLKDNYPFLFGRSGEMIMWGRSMPYRFASVIPLAFTGFEKEGQVNYGWMRRIASGVLKQFLTDPGFLKDNVPTLGFYGSFEPAVQPYSCRGSVFWMGKAFFALLLPEGHPFWTATENDGPWNSELKKDSVYHRFGDSAQILITNYPSIGASEVRAWCHVKAVGASEPFRASENYNRLSYNSAFPWQADSVEGVVSMNYIFRNKKEQWEPLRLYTFRKFEDGIYYRDAVLETNPSIRLRLADIPLPNGILRIDQNLGADSTEVRLGHYALPQLKEKISKQKRMIGGHEVMIISNGVYQLAMIPLKGWERIRAVDTEGVHPQSRHSAVINVSDTYKTGQKGKLYATLMLWKKAGERWREEELVPVKSIEVTSENEVRVVMKGGSKKVVSFQP